jgi:dipeptidase E
MASIPNYQLLLASTSTMPGERFLAYLSDEFPPLFGRAKTITFIPYARPSGMSWDSYTRHARQTLAPMGYNVRGIHQWDDPLIALQESEAFFTGGGNTFALVNSLHEYGLMEALAHRLAAGIPYLGCSAGTNIAGQNMQTTNDMPVVYPPSFETMGILPFNINAHYTEAVIPHHQGETRMGRIQEFQAFHPIPVLGLVEGSWLRVSGQAIKLEGNGQAKLFNPGQPPEFTDQIPFYAG